MTENSKSSIKNLKEDYPWIKTPVIASAPMRLIAEVELTLEVSKAGGIGFLAGGTDPSGLDQKCQELDTLLDASPLPTRQGVRAYGIGFITWGAPLEACISIIEKHKPSAVWFFAPHDMKDLIPWAQRTKTASPDTRIWIQVGCVADALAAVEHCQADVLVLQGQDAGGHGRFSAASIVSLIPEAQDKLAEQALKTSKPDPVLVAAGGIMDSRGGAAALALGASGFVLGTRLLGANEAVIADGYRQALLASEDGGISTVRSSVYDTVRGTLGWPGAYGGRGVTNSTWEDSKKGMSVKDNKALYDEAIKKGAEGWGFKEQANKSYAGTVADGRMTTYAGTGVGLVKKIQPAKEIIEEVRNGVAVILNVASHAV